MELSTILLISLIALIVAWVWYKLTFWSRQGIPNEISSFYNRAFKPLQFADQDSYLKYGRIVGVYEGLRPCLLLAEPNLIKKVLISEFDKFTNHRIFYHENQVAGKSLVSLENEKWKKCRKMMTPLFSTGNLKKMKPMIEDCVNLLIDNIEQLRQKDETIDMKKMLGSFSLDVVAKTVFGITLDSVNNPDHEIVRNVALFFGQNLPISSILVLGFPFLMKLFNLYVFQYETILFLNSLVHNILKNKKTQPPGKIKDFLSLLEEADISLLSTTSDKKTRDQIIVDNGILFIIAGYDTTSSSLCSVVYCLALFPEHQDKVVAEIDQIRKKFKTVNLSFDEINELEYLDAVIWESLRLLPAIPRIERRVNHDYELDSIKLPKDSLVIIPSYAINHDPAFFPKPETFDPTRFLGHREPEISHVYLPFATGPRNCIGMRFAILEMKICLINLLDNFKFNVSSQTKIPLEYYTGMPVTAPKDVFLRVTRREERTN